MFGGDVAHTSLLAVVDASIGVLVTLGSGGQKERMKKRRVASAEVQHVTCVTCHVEHRLSDIFASARASGYPLSKFPFQQTNISDTNLQNFSLSLISERSCDEYRCVGNGLDDLVSLLSLQYVPRVMVGNQSLVQTMPSYKHLWR